MNGINKCIIIGTLGKDPETRFIPSGGAVTNFSVATNETWKDKQTGEKQEKCEWHNISIFGKLAEIAGEYLKKGSQVYLEGKITTEKWKDKEGNDRYTTKIIANQMQMLGGNSDNSGQPAQQPQPANQPAPQPMPAGADGFDDAIPF